jgi:outer membrane protein assembly factor BamB
MMHRIRLRIFVLALCCWPLCAVAGDWPQFRGPNNDGYSADTSLPIDFSDASVAWKAELPSKGVSSPIVVGDKVFVTCSSGPQQNRLHVLCFDAVSGRQLWERTFWATGRTLINPLTAVAANTPASDGKSVVAMFSSNDLVCLDLAGNLKWFRGLAYDFPGAGNDIGMASSPQIVGDTVIAQVESQGEAFAAGIDMATGETRWQLEREHRDGHCSPTIVPGAKAGEETILLQSPRRLTGHDPRTGVVKFEYAAECDSITSPVSDGETIFLPAGGITALKLQAGVQTPTAAWTANKLKPGASSPVVHAGRIYTSNRAGVLQSADASTGEPIAQVRLKGPFWATPLLTDTHLVAVNQDGLVQVVQLGDKLELVGSRALDEPVLGSPAAADGAVYVRGDKHLWKFVRK